MKAEAAVAPRMRLIRPRRMSRGKIRSLIKLGGKSKANFNKALKLFQRELELDAKAEAELRLRWRQRHELVYVKQYTVKAHMRKLNKKKQVSVRAERLLLLS